eukprot:tig00021179_g19296.t1
MKEARALPLDPIAVIDHLVAAAATAALRAAQGRSAEAVVAGAEAVALLARHRRRTLVGPVYVYQLILAPLFVLADALESLLRSPGFVASSSGGTILGILRTVGKALDAGASTYPLVRPAAAIVRGRRLEAEGHPRRAAALFREAAAAAAAIGAQLFEARALHHLGHCAGARPEERAGAASSAELLFRQMRAHAPPAAAVGTSPGAPSPSARLAPSTPRGFKM